MEMNTRHKKAGRQSVAFCSLVWPFAGRQCRRTPLQKQSAGRHEAFRRSNCAFLTLVGKGDAKSRHSEILIVAAVTGFEFERLIEDYGAGNRFSVKRKSFVALFGDDVEFICMVFLAEDEVPGEVRHQTDMAGDAKLQSRAQLTKRSQVMIGNRIVGKEFAFPRLRRQEPRKGGRRSTSVLLVKERVDRRSAINKAYAAGDIGSKAAERIA